MNPGTASEARAGILRVGPMLDGLALNLMAAGLCLLLAALLTVPQRIAQRSGSRGVLALHLEADGGLKLWNRPVQERELRPLLAAAGERQSRGLQSRGLQSRGLQSRGLRLRLIPDPALPWGVVQERVATLERSGLPMELQLP
ncbi:MAG: hypothetical protein ACKOBY_06285 [Cyanobium sp.]